MKIATWNVDQPNPGPRAQIKHRIMAQLKAIDADIWVLTETTTAIDLSGLDYLKLASEPNTSWRNYPYFRVVIWSKWPIESVNDKEKAKQAVCGLIETPAGKLLVYGTIIPYRFAGMQRKENPAEPWEEHRQAIAAQSADWAMLRREYPHTPLCVAGDFNQTLRHARHRPKDVVDSLKEALGGKQPRLPDRRRWSD